MSYEALPQDYKNTFSLYTAMINLTGINFFSSHYSRVAKIRLFIYNLFFLPFILPQFFFIGQISADNFLEDAKVVPVSVMFFLDLIKMITAVAKKSEIKQVLLDIGELWPRGIESDERKCLVMKKRLRKMGFISYGFYIYAIMILAIYVITPLLKTCHNFHTGINEYEFPFKEVAFWKINSAASYLVTYVLEITGTVPCHICIYLPFDLLLIITISNVSILLHLLQIDLQRAVKDLNIDTGKRSNLGPESYKRLYRIVIDHQRLLRIATELNHIFGYIILIHVAFSSITICFFGFIAVVISGVADTITNFITVLYAIITIFLIAFSGQMLSDSSSSVADVAYGSLWYKCDTKVKKVILFIILRAQKPSYLSALGFTNMTLRSFSKIMSTAWTYFSLLIQLYADNKFLQGQDDASPA